MKLKLNTDGITRRFARTILVTKKNSPHIFFVGGVVGVVGAGVLACRATLKLEDTLDGVKSDIGALKALEEGKLEGKEATYKHATYVVAKSVGSLGKLYGPSLALGAVSVAALTGAHVQLTKRNAALSATLALVTKAYEEYRVRVQNDVGLERETDIHQNLSKQELVDSKGKSKMIKVAGPGGGSPYARYYDESNPNWQNNSEMNAYFIECQMRYANDKLHANGHVFLNDVYDRLGFPDTPEGAIMGWVRNGDGDGYIEFEVISAPRGLPFEVTDTGMPRNIILDFNVDGVIWNLI